MPFFHGIKVNEPLTGARPLTLVASAIIGMIVTAPDADAEDFPLDRPVLVTDIRTAIGQAGATGTLKPALEAIADQCSPVLVIVRVAEGADLEATETNIIGTVTDGVASGMQALLSAESQIGVRPRILGVPGFDSQDIVTALIPVAQKLRGFIYAKAVADDAAAAIVYRDEFAARELMLIWPETDSEFAGDTIARALGLRARIDEETGWHKTLSNVAINGVTGLSKDVPFDITDGSSTAGVLNAAHITTLVRMTGYRFWGNRTTSDEPLFNFESAVRTAQVLQDTIANGLIWAVDKPITASLVKDILETINAEFRSLQAEGRIIGANAWYDPANNSQVDLAAGKIVIDYDYTPAAPAEGITLNQRITDRFYADLAAQLTASL